MNAVHASERIAVAGYIAPDANAAGAILSNAIDFSKFERLMAVVQVGDLGSSATLDFKFQASATSGGTYADVTGAAITQCTQAGSDSNKTVILELKAETLASLSKPYVKGVLTVGTATSDCGVVILGVLPKYGPAKDVDIAAGTEGEVKEIVVA